MNIKEISSTIFKTKKRVLTFIVTLAVIVLAVIFLVMYNSTAKVDTTHFNQLLSEASDLTTAKLKITNMTKYEDEGRKLLSKSDFIMVYDATVWAGIDIEKIKITSDDIAKTIRVRIPKATIQNAKVDSSSIKLFDEKFSFFNLDQKEDMNKAVVLAEEKVIEEAAKTGILELADKQSAILIEGLLFKSIPKGYTLEVKVEK